MSPYLLRPAGTAATPQPLRSPSRRIWRLICPFGGLLGIPLVWLVLGASRVLDPSTMPGLPQVVEALGSELASEELWAALGATLTAWGLGLSIGATAGLLLGALIGLSSFLHLSTAVVVEFFKTVPIVAILPLAVLVLGTSLTMKVALVAFGVTWPLLVQTVYGVRSMDPVIRDTATVMGIGSFRRFFIVVLPSAAPFIATGLRIAAAGALVLTIVVELIAGGEGLGVEISIAAISGQASLPALYARIMVTGILGLLVANLLTRLERSVLRWHEAYRPEDAA